jgi:hypothetical protein
MHSINNAHASRMHIFHKLQAHVLYHCVFTGIKPFSVLSRMNECMGKCMYDIVIMVHTHPDGARTMAACMRVHDGTFISAG